MCFTLSEAHASRNTRRRYSVAMARMKDSITISDPKALRALAHPARQRLISELFGGRVLTATEAADLVGLTPSAVSHHLRALEKYGLAQRAKASGDARQRPWQGTARTLRLSASESTGGRVALQSVVDNQLQELSEQLDQFLTTRDNDPWAGAYQGLARGDLWLSEEETRELGETVMATLQKFDKRRATRSRASSTRHTGFAWALVPIGPAPESS